MSHVTKESWRRLLAGALSPDERARLLPHLGQACEECDDLVAELEDPALDARVDGALGSLTAVQPDALALDRIERQVMRRAFPRSKRAWWALAPVALAAGAALVVLNPLAPASTGQRLKGDPLRSPELTAVVWVKAGAPLEPLVASHTYPHSAELFFTYDLPQDAHVYMGRVGIDGVVEPFYPPLGSADSVERAGLHSLIVGGAVHAYSLEGLREKQRFVLLSSPAPLKGPALEQALKQATERSASVEVEVEPW